MPQHNSDPLLRLTVFGVPAPQGSKRGVIHKHTGRVVMIESSERVGPWREDIKNAAVRAFIGGAVDEPVVVDMVFTFARPASHYGTGRNAGVLRDSAPARPATKPDLSKLCRAVEDALTDAGVWRDDARVVEYGRLAKVFVREDGDALDRPGVLVRIWRLADLTADLDNLPATPGTLFDTEGALA